MNNVTNNEIKMVSEAINLDVSLDEPKRHYVGVMFEDRFKSTEKNPKFYGKTYTYVTTRDLKEGQVIQIQSNSGLAKVCVVNENVDPATIDFDLSLLKEI